VALKTKAYDGKKQSQCLVVHSSTNILL